MESLTGEVAFMANAAGQALFALLEPQRLMFLGVGCLVGLVLGIVPGIGGLAGTAMILPFTFTMDPYSAFALLLGLGATTATGDPIPAILFGIPGGAASAATVLDGFPMAKRGEAGRALSAAYMSSLMGGLFGALLLAVTIPILRPVMLYIGSPELLAFSVLGISMVAVLSGNAPLRGVTAGCLGVMIAMVGTDPKTGTARWTFDSFYLWEGVPLTPLLLGVFALPELCDLLIGRVRDGNPVLFESLGLSDRCILRWGHAKFTTLLGYVAVGIVVLRITIRCIFNLLLIRLAVRLFRSTSPSSFFGNSGTRTVRLAIVLRGRASIWRIRRVPRCDSQILLLHVLPVGDRTRCNHQRGSHEPGQARDGPEPTPFFRTMPKIQTTSPP